GFDYTKLDSSGNAVAANATNHECFRDNVTGLVWQASASNSTVDYDATSGSAVPASLCGISTGWRLPTKAEAESLLHYSRAGVSVDTSLFATAPTNSWYWTRSPYPAALSGGVQNDSTGSAHHNWVINFTTGQRSTFDTYGNTAQSQARTLYVNSTANQ
uniref:Lcl C-terminal domain-containing protein n=1 Tax=Marinospirillum sp. TaxID=2183934 RepID=UPI003A83799A